MDKYEFIRIQFGKDGQRGVLLADLYIYYPNGKTVCVSHTGDITEITPEG